MASIYVKDLRTIIFPHLLSSSCMHCRTAISVSVSNMFHAALPFSVLVVRRIQQNASARLVQLWDRGSRPVRVKSMLHLFSYVPPAAPFILQAPYSSKLRVVRVHDLFVLLPRYWLRSMVDLPYLVDR